MIVPSRNLYEGAGAVVAVAIRRRLMDIYYRSWFPFDHDATTDLPTISKQLLLL